MLTVELLDTLDDEPLESLVKISTTLLMPALQTTSDWDNDLLISIFLQTSKYKSLSAIYTCLKNKYLLKPIKINIKDAIADIVLEAFNVNISIAIIVYKIKIFLLEPYIFL